MFKGLVSKSEFYKNKENELKEREKEIEELKLKLEKEKRALRLRDEKNEKLKCENEELKNDIEKEKMKIEKVKMFYPFIKLIDELIRFNDNLLRHSKLTRNKIMFHDKERIYIDKKYLEDNFFNIYDHMFFIEKLNLLKLLSLIDVSEEKRYTKKVFIEGKYKRMIVFDRNVIKYYCTLCG